MKLYWHAKGTRALWINVTNSSSHICWAWGYGYRVGRSEDVIHGGGAVSDFNQWTSEGMVPSTGSHWRTALALAATEGLLISAPNWSISNSSCIADRCMFVYFSYLFNGANVDQWGEFLCNRRVPSLYVRSLILGIHRISKCCITNKSVTAVAVAYPCKSYSVIRAFYAAYTKFETRKSCILICDNVRFTDNMQHVLLR